MNPGKLRTVWPIKHCEFCGELLVRKRYSTGKLEQKSNFIKRRFCDVYCQTQSYRAEFDKKYCLHCGKEMKRRKNEISVTYRSRQFCNHECYSLSLVKEDPTDSQWYRRLRESRDKKECIICKTTENLHNHHIDKNIRNNNEDNLLTLCGSCHIKFHAITRKIERQYAKS